MVRAKGKGGKKPLPRVQTPHVDTAELREALHRHISVQGVATALALGPYQKIPVGNAVNGYGLLGIKVLIQTLVAVCPSLVFKFLDLKTVLAGETAWFENLLPAGRKTDKWAGDQAERLMTVCAHARRLRHSDLRMTQACRKLDEGQEQELRALISKVQLQSRQASQPSLASQASRASQLSPAKRGKTPSPQKGIGKAVPESDQRLLGTPKRKLQRESSTLSVDSQGYPMMLKRPKLQPAAAASPPAKARPGSFGEGSPAPGSPTPTQLYDPDLLGSPVLPKAVLAALKRPASTMKKPAAAAAAAEQEKAANAEAAEHEEVEPAQEEHEEAEPSQEEGSQAAKKPLEYNAAKKAYKGKCWLTSAARQQAISAMSRAEVVRRRFQPQRPDLFPDFKMHESSKE